MNVRSLILAAALATAPVWAQQAKTGEAQARSYILSAFMTGAAPLVLSSDVKVTPALRKRLAVAPESDSRAVYYALVRVTAGKTLHVRPPRDHEIAMAEAKAEAGKPLFALTVNDSVFVLQYDLDHDAVTYAGDGSGPVAVTSPVAPPREPQPIAEAPTAQASPAPTPEASPAVAPAAATPPPPVAPAQVVEPREPRFVKPAPAGKPAGPVTRNEPQETALRPSGPCVIKPVMSDQDMVNCGSRR